MLDKNALITVKKYYIAGREVSETKEYAEKCFEQYLALISQNEGVKRGELALIRCVIDFFTKNAAISRDRVKAMVYKKVKRNIFIPIPEREELAFRATSTTPIGLVTLVDPKEVSVTSPSTFFADSETIIIKEDTIIPFSSIDALGKLPLRLFTMLQISQYFRLYIARVVFVSEYSEDELHPMRQLLKEERMRLRAAFDKLSRMKKDKDDNGDQEPLI